MVSQSTKNSRRARVEEHEAGGVDRSGRIVEQGGVEGLAEPVGGQDVEPAVADERRDFGHRVEDALDDGPHRSWPGRRRVAVVGLRGADEVEEMGAFGFVELQCASDALEYLLGHAVGGPALEARVVLDADAGEHRDLFAPQALHPTLGAVGGQARLVGGELRSA